MLVYLSKGALNPTQCDKDKPLSECLSRAFPIKSEKILINKNDAVSHLCYSIDQRRLTLMEPLRIQTHTAAGRAVRSNISDLTDKFSLPQSKHIWLYSVSWGGKGALFLLSLAVGTQPIFGSR